MKPSTAIKLTSVVIILLTSCCSDSIAAKSKGKTLQKHGAKGCFSLASYLAAQKANKPYTICRRPFKCGDPNGTKAYENKDPKEKAILDKFVPFSNITESTKGICVCEFLPLWKNNECQAGSDRVLSRRYLSILVVLALLINGIGLRIIG